MSDGIEEFGPYVVYERLGQGGMATVHRAEKRGVGFRRPIALKRLLPHVAADPDLVTLFVDEARLASHLHHANVAQTYELGKVGEIFFIAMEYASGPTLTQVIRQCQKAAGEIPLTIAVNILGQICEALDYAHNLCDETGKPLKIIHRDVSPANIIVANTGIVKLIDFGIAKTTLSSVKTQTGFIKGKFGYIAPEYITGRIDSRVDLFAVGVVAHEMMSGRRLFEGKDDFETLANIRDMVMQPPSHWNPHVTPDLDDIVMTALARDPDHRWQSAAAMQVALQTAAREFGLPVGSQQLVEWVQWAFSQVPGGESGPVLRADPHADTMGPQLDSRYERAPGSSVSIEMADLPSEAPTPRPELLRRRAAPDAATPRPRGRRPSEPDMDSDKTSLLNRRALSPSESDETMPVDRVHNAFSDLELLTPPAMAAARAAAPALRKARDAAAAAQAPRKPPAAAPGRSREAEPAPPRRRPAPTGSPPGSAHEAEPAPPRRRPAPTGSPPGSSREAELVAAARAAPVPRPAPPPTQPPPTARTARAVEAAVLPALPAARRPAPTQPPPLPRSTRESVPPPVPRTRPSRDSMPPPTPPPRVARELEPGGPARPRAEATAVQTPAPAAPSPRVIDADGTPAPRPPLPFSPAAQAGSSPRIPRAGDDADPSASRSGTGSGSGALPRFAEASVPPALLADAMSPPVPSSRDVSVIIIPPGGMFDEPTPAPETRPAKKTKPGKPDKPDKHDKHDRSAKLAAQPELAAKPDKAKPAKPGKAKPEQAKAAKSDQADPPKATKPPAPARKRTGIVVALLIVLGVGGMAVAYFWPDLEIWVQGLIDR